ncbi:hypothetical protein, partial [Helicobacter winghamensis]
RDITGSSNPFSINGTTVTIKKGGIVSKGTPVVDSYNASTSSIAVGNSTNDSSIFIEEGGRLDGRIYTRRGKINTLNVEGSIGAGNSNASIINFRQTKIGTINIGKTGVLEGAIINSWFATQGLVTGKSVIDEIIVTGTIKGGVENQSGTMKNIQVSGTINGDIKNEDIMTALI